MGTLFHHRRQELFSLGLAGAVGALGWPVRFEFPPFLRDYLHFPSCFVWFVLYVCLDLADFPTSSRVFLKFFHPSGIHWVPAVGWVLGVGFWGYKDDLPWWERSSYTLFTNCEELAGGRNTQVLLSRLPSPHLYRVRRWMLHHRPQLPPACSFLPYCPHPEHVLGR